MNRDELTRLVLIEVARQCAAVLARPAPDLYQSDNLSRWRHGEDVKYGPRYSPVWFGEIADTEARRVRVLRTLKRLAEAGLIVLVESEAGRLSRVRMTPAGLQAVAELTGGEPERPAP